MFRIFRERKTLSRWPRPARYDRNLIVIGGGAAGLVGAYIAAATKARVTLVTDGPMGGDCLNFGCVPSKALIRAARIAHLARRAEDFGLVLPPAEVDFPAVMARIGRVIDTIAPNDSVERYEGLGVEVLRGHARIADPWTVEIAAADGTARKLTTRAILVATGAAPVLPDLPGLAEAGCLTSDSLWSDLAAQARIPARIAILGGGPIGCELAQALARLGAGVTLIEAGPRLLPREDADAAALVRAAMERDGVTVLTGHRAIACGRDPGGIWIETEAETEAETAAETEAGAKGPRHRIGADRMIAALGRAPRLTGLGLEALGITPDGASLADAFQQTSVPTIFLAGDVAGPFRFTHAAAHQAWHAAVNALFGQIWRLRADRAVIPWTTFTDPEVARAGLNEDEARARGIAHQVTLLPLSALDRAIADGTTDGFVKVLTPPGSDRILGVTVVGDHAGDVIAEHVLAMSRGIGLNGILGTVHVYPTLAEANKLAAGAWRRSRVSPRTTALLRRYHDWRRG